MEVSTFPVLAKTDVTALHYLPVVGRYRFSLLSLFPSLATSGTGSEKLYVGITSKNQLNFKGIKSSDGLLTVSTVSDNIVFTMNPSALDLNNCDNSTSKFLKKVDLSSSEAESVLPVTKGGTGMSSIAKGAIVYSSAANTLAASQAMDVNGCLLIGNNSTGLPTRATLTAGTNVSITNGPGSITIAASLTTLTAALDCSTYSINLNYAAGASWLSGDGSAEGVLVDTSGRVFIGDSTPTLPSLTSQLTLGGAGSTALTIGNVNHYTDRTIQVQNASGATDGINLSLYGANGGTGNRAGGALKLYAGTASGTGTAGNIELSGGDPGASGTAGKVLVRNYISSTLTTVAEFSGGNMTMEKGAPVIPYTTTLTGAGAVPITHPNVLLVTTGANALTLADGTLGQDLYIFMKTDGGDGTLTPTSPKGYSTITFNDAGDTVHLRFIDSKWFIVGYYGVTIA